MFTNLNIETPQPVNFLSQEVTTLIIKNLPDLGRKDVDSFFQHFGALQVRPMETNKMKNTAFVDFPDRNTAALAFGRLQQLDFHGNKLRVEYALPNKSKLENTSHTPDIPNPHPYGHSGETTNPTEQPSGSSYSAVNPNPLGHGHAPAERSGLTEMEAEPIAPELGINYPSQPNLYYRYPPPTVDTLKNIMNAIVAVPKLYTQVLHLMNKMNLPPPFGPVTATPPMLVEAEIIPEEKKAKPKDELVCTDESEIESSDEG
ncbi:hypothetical protein K493DRAFT_350071 [Basidiobolus meristosporus CBS 931.73]|uniref:RRM domain-containing protein n=1 Tax=Basidiobolus meristosporus CBS 931.73 TaxID=1314790 RepID=A0A1Y1YHB9_9FUNG|nr:hypothetical protein K493DRAFT_350071 [Basidiobolus meristosporus CBS 931.73]|eukprot:ORX97412.1 hypothetical protein K493DRAFT_350071 [Basidiobolus meristosporus CBS 931.73]